MPPRRFKIPMLRRRKTRSTIPPPTTSTIGRDVSLMMTTAMMTRRRRGAGSENINVYVPPTLVWCGHSPSVAREIKLAFEPEYEVVHICLGVDQAVSHIPQLLRGMIPRQMREDPEQLGSMSYVSRIGAIVVGPGSGIIQSMHDVVKMREACLNDRGVPWLFADVTGIEDPYTNLRSGKALVERAKKVLREVEREGKMEKDGFYLY